MEWDGGKGLSVLVGRQWGTDRLCSWLSWCLFCSSSVVGAAACALSCSSPGHTLLLACTCGATRAEVEFQHDGAPSHAVSCVCLLACVFLLCRAVLCGSRDQPRLAAATDYKCKSLKITTHVPCRAITRVA